MPFAPIKFRCPRCSQLLGAPPTKAGRAIRCPKCRVELVVPDPPPAVAEPTAVELGPSLVTPTSGEFRTLAGSDADFLSMVPPPPGPSHVVEVAAPIDARPEEPEAPAGDWTSDSVVVFDAPPISARLSSGDPAIDDVPIPRLVLTGGCLLGLLAIAGAFGSGLLIGKYVWRDAPPPAKAR